MSSATKRTTLGVATSKCFMALALLAAFTKPASAITFGQPDGHRHPSAGAIVLHHNIPGIPNPFIHCSGVLIHERIFLTAGHCADGLQSLINSGVISLDQLFVTLNPDPFVPSSWRPVSGLAAHFEQARVSHEDHDIGALILVDPVTDVPPAKLAPMGFLEQETQPQLINGHFDVVGYGWGSSLPPLGPDTSDRTRKFATPRFISLLGNFVFMQQNSAAGNSGINDWDSGGPLFWTDPITGADTLVAITTFADPLRVAYCGFYRLEIQPSSAFIQGVIGAMP